METRFFRNSSAKVLTLSVTAKFFNYFLSSDGKTKAKKGTPLIECLHEFVET